MADAEPIQLLSTNCYAENGPMRPLPRTEHKAGDRPAARSSP